MESDVNPSLSGDATHLKNRHTGGATINGTVESFPEHLSASPHRDQPIKAKQIRLQYTSKTPPISADSHNRYYGADHTTKRPDQYRFVFNNINGIQLSHISLKETIAIARDLQVDWLGLAETHLDSKKHHVQAAVRKAASDKHNGFKAINCVFSQSDIDYGSDRKFGGVLQMATDNLASRTVTTYSDRYGRWTSQTHSGKKGTMLTTISAYRVADGCKGPSSSYAQQRAMLVTENRAADPRRMFITDLTEYIHKCQSSGHEVVLCLDANESMSHPNSAIRRLANDCGLADVHQTTCPDISRLNSHRAGSSQIDFCFASPKVMSSITQTGILAFDDAFGGDHRAMYFDLDIISFFHGITANPVSFQGRAFTTKDKKKTKTFTDAAEDAWTHRNLSSRIQILSAISRLPSHQIRREKVAAMYEQIDAEITRAFDTATASLNIPKSHRQWSPEWAAAGASKRYWRARIKNVWAGHDDTEALHKLRVKYNIADDGTTDINTLTQRYDMAVKHHSSITKRDVDYREHHLDHLIEVKSAEVEFDPTAKKELSALKSLKEAEKQSNVFKKIGRTLKPMSSGGISRVEIPLAMSNAMQTHHLGPTEGPIQNTNEQLRDVLKRTIRTKKSDGTEEWVTILDKDQMENAILLYCQEHFQQASATPFGHGHLADLIGTSGLTEAGKQILQGTLFSEFDAESFPELATFIAELAMPEEIKQLDPISNEISIEDWHKGFKNWRESTSTSPSGRHLGIYKALLSNLQITADLCEMLNIVIRLKLTPSRWCKAISVLLEKDHGSPCVNRLRVIHLFEADYNFFLKLMWASRLVHRGEDTNNFGVQQYGSRSRLSALDPSMLKRLTYDLTRILRSNLGTFDNDAKSCYDRIINGIAMISAQRLGMSEEAIAVHAGVLWAMQYTIKTMYGISDGYYRSTKEAMLFGTGQGSGASPAVWLSISVVLLASLHRLIKRGMRFATPSDHIHVERMSDSFVDDTQNGLNDAHLPTPLRLDQLIRNLEHMAQSWERLLYSSGGALELSKCFYCIVYWKWIKGLPTMLRTDEMAHITPIRLTSGYNLTTGKFGPLTDIKQTDPHDSNKTLGIRQATTGDDTDQCSYLRQESIRIANLALTSNFTKYEAYTAYRFCYIPFVSYSLGTTTLTDHQLHSISGHATGTFLTRMGFNRHFPRAAAYGPLEFGGLALYDLTTEQGVLQIKLLLEHVYHTTETGKLLMIAVHSLQMEAGISAPILTDLSQELPYITPCWVTSLRHFMYRNNISLEFADVWNHSITRKHDLFLMDVFINMGYTTMELRHLNAVRIYLQVATLAEIATADGLSIDTDMYYGVKSTTRTSLIPHWIRQPEITLEQRSLWKMALSTHFARRQSTLLHHPVGEWISPPTQQWSTYYDLDTRSLFRYTDTTFQKHLPCVDSLRRPSRHAILFSEGNPTHLTTISDLPSTAIPADILQDFHTGKCTACFGSLQYPDKQLLSISLPSTVSEYTQTLPLVRQRLLAQCFSPEPMVWEDSKKIFYQTRTLAGLFECATDGGLQNRQGTFGWVMTGSETHFQSGAGPVDGDPETASSTRSEWFGYAGLLEAFILLDSILSTSTDYEAWEHMPITRIHTWIDNKAVSDHIQEMLDCTFRPRREYPHDADIISHIQWQWSNLSRYKLTAGWVRSHQDKNGQVLVTSLTVNAQLNVMADGLATDYYHHGLIRPRSQPFFFPSSKVSLLVNKQRATAQYYAIIRFHINGTAHKRFLQSTRPTWYSEQVWKSIDMQGLGLAFKTMSKPKQQATSKMMHGWWNTGHQRSKITLESHSGCPCCPHLDETTEHILRCKAPTSSRTRYLALISLKSAGRVHGITSLTWDILYQGIRLWLHYGDQMPQIDLTAYKLHHDHRQLILRALKEQHLIGWQYACRGYLSTTWVAAQSFGHTPDSSTRIRHTWLRPIIKAIWCFTDTMWAHRNLILHGKEASAKMIRESAVDQQIRTHYADQMEYALVDQVIFDLPLDDRLRRPIRSKKHWLVLAMRYHPTTRQRQMGNQPLMTTFFNPNQPHSRQRHRRPHSRHPAGSRLSSPSLPRFRQSVLRFE